MDLSAILNVALGLFFVYLITSLLASEIQEYLASILQWRAKHLQRAIENLINGGIQLRNINLKDVVDESDEESVNVTVDQINNLKKTKRLLAKLYQNPLIKSVNHEAKGLDNQNELKSKSNSKVSGPSYIPSDTFATALIMTIVQQASTFKDNAEITLDNFKTALEEDKIKNLLPEDLKITLLTLIDKAKFEYSDRNKDLKTLQEELATWFDESMTRAAGVYKRQSKVISFLIGLVISLALNIDTINISNQFYKNHSVRAAVNQVTNRIVNETNVCLQQELNSNDCYDTITSAVDDLAFLPIGWGETNLIEQFEEPNHLPRELGLTWVYFKFVLGIILSAIAICMGAPFWFEVLNKLVNVRNTGEKPKSSRI
ncbi:MAG: hypothetical protein F6K26_38085, partial [Moorea sp. SIO2I5]|nr:hypothetical protein [Moorena sp. SIO2I5]